jgi:hypothetical protein
MAEKLNHAIASLSPPSAGFFVEAPGMARCAKRNQLGRGGHAGDLEVKVLYTPGKGKCCKGVAGDRESEGSPRQNAGLTNRKRIRRRSGVRWP